MDSCRQSEPSSLLDRVLAPFRDNGPGTAAHAPAMPKVALVGSPNVGKSALFNALTGAYVTVSNYPGTTVEITRGVLHLEGTPCEIIDTPGMYSLLPVTEEERVARDVLLEQNPGLVVHIVDAKNLGRMLPLTLQLIEAELNVVLVLNMMDEARRAGITIDRGELARQLGVPVAGTSAVQGEGVAHLKWLLQKFAAETTSRQPSGVTNLVVDYGEQIEGAIGRLVNLLRGRYEFGTRAVAILLVQGDALIEEEVKRKERQRYKSIREILDELTPRDGTSLPLDVSMRRREVATELTRAVFKGTSRRPTNTSELLGRLAMHPVWGLPILALVVYYGLYQFVGVFGAGTLVDFLEEQVFAAYFNPWINGLLTEYVPWPSIRELLGFEYGVITLGVRYATAIVLPIVGTFFVVFSVIEDSGYLPRLAMLVDRLFRSIGLSGRAVIPMTLGFGCDTMATMVTRTLETERERIIATLLLALAIPCSAQLGVILALLSGNAMALVLWAAFVGGVLVLVGWLSAQILPGERPSFYMELPPLRFPSLNNVLSKTWTRVYWYFLEVLPLFILASVLIWIGRLTGAFEAAIAVFRPAVEWIGLPSEAAEAFLFGFFRRDYGAAGLYDLVKAGMLSPVQLVVAASTLTLFVPCVAQFVMMWKERGWATTMAITLFIIPFAFGAGWLIHMILSTIPLL